MAMVVVKDVKHVALSQCYEGSRGRAKQYRHAHVSDADGGAVTLTAVSGRRTTITRNNDALCGHKTWYENPDGAVLYDPCPKCVTFAKRYGIDWPAANPGGDQ